MHVEHQFNSEGHLRRLIATPSPDGWEVREETDRAVVRQTRRRDWRRVELDIEQFRRNEGA